MASTNAAEELIAKTIKELSLPAKPIQRSRTWESPNAYRYLVQWSNAVLLRFLIRLFTAALPKSEYRRKAQLDDAGRSVVRNIEEGWKRSNTADYLDFLGYSQGSLEEVKGDIRELTEDGFLKSVPGSGLKSMSIDLKDFNTALKSNPDFIGTKRDLKENKGGLEDDTEGYIPITVLYPPLKNVKAGDLSYEVFMELINKTDYLLRTLVQSLEKKLGDNRKGYQIEQARIKDKFK